MDTRPFFAAALAVALAACNSGQPRTYRIALDMTPVRYITDSKCYKNNVVPAPNESTANLFDEQQWVIWDGASQDGSPLQFLDFGKQAHANVATDSRPDSGGRKHVMNQRRCC